MNFAELVHDYVEYWNQEELARAMEVVSAFCHGLIGDHLKPELVADKVGQLSRQHAEVLVQRRKGRAVRLPIADVGKLVLMASTAPDKVTRRTKICSAVGVKFEVVTLQDEHVWLPVYGQGGETTVENYLGADALELVSKLCPIDNKWQVGQCEWRFDLRPVDDSMIPDEVLRSSVELIMREDGRRLSKTAARSYDWNYRARPSAIGQYYRALGMHWNASWFDSHTYIPKGEWVGLVYR